MGEFCSNVAVLLTGALLLQDVEPNHAVLMAQHPSIAFLTMSPSMFVAPISGDEKNGSNGGQPPKPPSLSSGRQRQHRELESSEGETKTVMH